MLFALEAVLLLLFVLLSLTVPSLFDLGRSPVDGLVTVVFADGFLLSSADDGLPIEDVLPTAFPLPSIISPLLPLPLCGPFGSGLK